MMDKKFFLAVFLSIGVVFLTNLLFTKPPQPEAVQGYSEQQSIPTHTKPLSVVEEASASQPASEEIIEHSTEILENDDILIEIDSYSGAIQKIYFKKYDHKIIVKDVFLVDGWNNFRLDNNSSYIKMSKLDNGILLTKKVSLQGDFLLNTHISFYNQNQTPIAIDSAIKTMTIVGDTDQGLSMDGRLQEYAVAKQDKIERKGSAFKFKEKEHKISEESPKWLGFRDRYFAIIAKPNYDMQGYVIKPKGELELSLMSKKLDKILNPSETITYDFDVYVGPQDAKIMKQYESGYEKFFKFSGFFLIDWIAWGLYYVIFFIFSIVKNWGVAIIVLCGAVYGATYPLSYKSMKTMREFQQRMQKVQPEMNRIREKYKDDTQKQSMEMMKLYQKHDVNPLSGFKGCFPMLIQMPIWFGVYQILLRAVDFKNAQFLWIKDLSQPDRLIQLPSALPLVGEYINILPILMGITMFIQQKLNVSQMATTPEQEAQQKMMTILMPIMILFIFYNFASGLSLYFTVYYLLSAITQARIKAATSAGT